MCFKHVLTLIFINKFYNIPNCTFTYTQYWYFYNKNHHVIIINAAWKNKFWLQYWFSKLLFQLVLFSATIYQISNSPAVVRKLWSSPQVHSWNIRIYYMNLSSIKKENPMNSGNHYFFGDFLPFETIEVDQFKRILRSSSNFKKNWGCLQFKKKIEVFFNILKN